ncbi:MAG: ABC transporter ATP-binding protein [Acidobacteria bacterium]|nr:MAG: ABC transporter ATP-binding protein [Acidobacteriota bacterium]
MDAVRLERVRFGYEPGRPVVEDVDLAVPDGGFAALIGPNGGGKTTLLRLIAGLLEPWSGTVRVYGRPPRAMRGAIGYVPQHVDVDARFPMPVLDAVLLGRLGAAPRPGPWPRRDVEAARAALAEVGLAGMETRPFAELSGGERQRVLVARAIACEPRLLLLDEPTAHVDLVAGARFQDLLARLRRRMTIVLVSHDLGVVSSLVDEVICVGRRVAVHPTADLDGAVLSELYGDGHALVAHRHDLREPGA